MAGEQPRNWIVGVQEVYGGLVTLGSPENHQTGLTLSFDDWVTMGRPGMVTISPQPWSPRV